MDDSTDLDAMTQMANDLDDLGNLFEFGDIDLNTMPDAGDFGGQSRQQHGAQSNTHYQNISDAPPIGSSGAPDFGGHDQFVMSQQLDHARQQHFLSSHGKHTPTSNPYSVDPIYQAAFQQAMYQVQQSYQIPSHHVFSPAQHIPPTPNSFEMYGETGRFMQQHPQMNPQQRAIMEQRYGLRKEDAVIFTPMASPAGTPQFNVAPEFTTPGAYFSPLTSPMLVAQNQQHAHPQQQGYVTNPSTASSSHTNSPLDPNIDIDMLGDGVVAPNSTGPQPRKSRRKPATPRSVASRTQSQQKLPQRAPKRKPTSSDAPIATSGNSSQHSSRSQTMTTDFQVAGQFDSSEASSISPEPLNESIMGPPPRPGSSVHQSPNITGQQQRSGGAPIGPAATPRSILTRHSSQQLTNGQQSSNQGVVESAGLDDLALPEAATKSLSRKPSLPQIDTQIALPDEDENTPRLSARKTPKLGPTSTPSSARLSALESLSMNSPTTASTPSAILYKKDGKGSKKRGSMSANGSKLVSPALVPKLSPSIKPLLPEGTPLNSAQQAILLASKSNYQNLVEGNRLPGVTYPESLSTGLTSKRTSHKVAEQGRRNRINEALKEMQALIPKPIGLARSPPRDEDPGAAIAASPDGGEDEERTGDANATAKESKEEAISKSNSSKAATVELANEYIKRMQKESADRIADFERLKHENEELKRKLAEVGNECGDADISVEKAAADSPDKMAETVMSPVPA